MSLVGLLLATYVNGVSGVTTGAEAAGNVRTETGGPDAATGSIVNLDAKPEAKILARGTRG